MEEHAPMIYCVQITDASKSNEGLMKHGRVSERWPLVRGILCNSFTLMPVTVALTVTKATKRRRMKTRGKKESGARRTETQVCESVTALEANKQRKAFVLWTVRGRGIWCQCFLDRPVSFLVVQRGCRVCSVANDSWVMVQLVQGDCTLRKLGKKKRFAPIKEHCPMSHRERVEMYSVKESANIYVHN